MDEGILYVNVHLKISSKMSLKQDFQIRPLKSQALVYGSKLKRAKVFPHASLSINNNRIPVEDSV